MSESNGNNADERLEAAFDQMENEQKPTSSGSPTGILAIFLALVAVGIATWPAYEIYRQSQEDTESADLQQVELERLGKGLTRMTAQLSDLQHQLQSFNTSSYSSQDEMAALSARIDADLEAIRGRLTTSSEDWLFAEVEYLVRMANQRVLMEQDAASALQLLEAADRIVKDTEGLAAHALRQALASDMAALKAVDSPDVQGIYLELSALIGQIPALKRTVPSYEPDIPDTEPLATGSSLERSVAALREAGVRLSQLVDFRRRDVAIKPILPPDQTYYLRQNLALKLQIAQMALLENQPEVYRLSLEEAGRWLTSSFDDDTGTTAMKEALSRLGATRAGVDLPDISDSLNAARDALTGFKGSGVQ